MTTEWMEQAACKGMDTAIFFPELGEPIDEALAVCARCPVAKDCLIYAYSHPNALLGIWGGTSGNERRRKPRPRIEKLPDPIAHGTDGGYQKHVRRRIPACEACKAAHRDYVARQKERVSA